MRMPNRTSCWPRRLDKPDDHNLARGAFDVWNTSGWPRTDLIVLYQAMSTAGDVVVDASNKPVPSQRLSTGELAFLAKDVPPLAGLRDTDCLPTKSPSTVIVFGLSTLCTTPSLAVRLDPVSGAIVSLRKTRT